MTMNTYTRRPLTYVEARIYEALCERLSPKRIADVLLGVRTHGLNTREVEVLRLMHAEEV